MRIDLNFKCLLFLYFSLIINIMDVSNECTKFVDAGAFYDLEILIGEKPNDTTFRLHSMILKNRSTYFSNILSSDRIKTENNIIKFQRQDISVEIFHVI